MNTCAVNFYDAVMGRGCNYFPSFKPLWEVVDGREVHTKDMVLCGFVLHVASGKASAKSCKGRGFV